MRIGRSPESVDCQGIKNSLIWISFIKNEESHEFGKKECLIVLKPGRVLIHFHLGNFPLPLQRIRIFRRIDGGDLVADFGFFAPLPREIGQTRRGGIDLRLGIGRERTANLMVRQADGKLAEAILAFAPLAVEAALDPRPFQFNLARFLADGVAVACRCTLRPRSA